MKIAVTIFILLFTIFETNASGITVIATGELHSQIKECECPDSIVGGVARISTFVNGHWDKNKRLLIDGGGFSAGGVYDVGISGKIADSIRTVTMLSLLSSVGYDAVGVGDDDLQLGATWLRINGDKEKIPFVSCNILDKLGNYIFEPYKIIKKSGLKFFVTSVVTPERLFPLGNDFVVKNPFKALEKIMDIGEEKADFTVVISHLGEENSIRISKRFSEIDLLLNAHRKISAAPIVQVKNAAPILQFGFLGKMISTAVVKKHGIQISPKWSYISRSIKPDSAIEKLASKFENAIEQSRKDVYTLYIMSQCPYGLPALKEMLKFRESAFDRIEFKLNFIGDVSDSGELHSLHGNGEIIDEMKYIAVRELYPKFWEDFLFIVSNSEKGAEYAISEMGLDTLKINNFVKNKAKSILKEQYKLSNRLKIDASPTLLVNNLTTEFPVNSDYLKRNYCQSRKDSDLCTDLPECLDDYDCQKNGKIGKCITSENQKKCGYYEPVKFKLTIIESPGIFNDKFLGISHSIKELFKGCESVTVLPSSAEWKKLTTLFNPSKLPFYLFEKKVETSAEFGKISEFLEQKNGSYIFKSEAIEGGYFRNRAIKENSITVFIDPTLPAVSDLLKVLSENLTGLKHLQVYPLIDSTLDYLNDTLECIVIKWMNSLDNPVAIEKSFEEGCNFDIGKISDDIRGKIGKISGIEKFFEISKSVAFLINNKELVFAQNRQQFNVIVNKILNNNKK